MPSGPQFLHSGRDLLSIAVHVLVRQAAVAHADATLVSTRESAPVPTPVELLALAVLVIRAPHCGAEVVFHVLPSLCYHWILRGVRRIRTPSPIGDIFYYDQTRLRDATRVD